MTARTTATGAGLLAAQSAEGQPADARGSLVDQRFTRDQIAEKLKADYASGRY